MAKRRRPRLSAGHLELADAMYELHREGMLWIPVRASQLDLYGPLVLAGHVKQATFEGHLFLTPRGTIAARWRAAKRIVRERARARGPGG